MKSKIKLMLISVLLIPMMSCEINCNHEIITVAAKEATCFEDGHSESSYCTKCGKVFEPSITYPAGHRYELNEIYLNQYKKGKYECKLCHDHYDQVLTYEDVNMPILSLTGDISKMSKDKKVTLDATYESSEQSFDSKCTLKWQGSSSLGYPKKNFNIQFTKDDGKKNKVELISSVGKQSKYTLKANYIDFSQARNVVSARLFNQIVHSRSIEDDISKLNNGGVIDGYPILIYINNEYQGLYTLNIAKEDYMFGFEGDEDSREAFVSCGDWVDECFLTKTISDFESGVELEYCSTEDNQEVGTSWVIDSWNNFINFLNNSNDYYFKVNLKNYTSKERAIDTFIYTVFIQAGDNKSKNINYATYNGTKWYPSMYDMDGTWGLLWDGSIIQYTNEPYSSVGRGGWTSLLYRRLYKNNLNEIKNRYHELRETILSKENVLMEFTKFFDSIPSVIYDTEKLRWTNVPSQETNNLEQIMDFFDVRSAFLDNDMK